MYYNNKPGEGSLFLLGVYGITAYFLYLKFGPKSIILTAAIPAIYLAYLQASSYKRSLISAHAKCEHGKSGAKADRKKCAQCTSEDKTSAIAAVKKIDDEAQRLKALRLQDYIQWTRNIRLPEYLHNMHPLAFEELICDLFTRLGYEVGLTKYTGDGGIDGYLHKNGEVSLLQCKRVMGSVGQPVLRDLYGTIHHEHADSGIVVTTGKVSQQAKEWIINKPIRVMELPELLQLIRSNYSESDIVPDDYKAHIIKAAKHVCPLCSDSLKIIKWKGKNFVGCLSYPTCRYTRTKM